MILSNAHRWLGIRDAACRHLVRRVLTVGFLVAAIMVGAERDACAYADPGSGALMWQLLLAALVGVSFYFRKFIGWVAAWRKKTEKDQSADGDG